MRLPPLPLPPDEVHLWHLDPDAVPDPLLARYRTLLTDDEYAGWLQARIFSHGRVAAPVPPFWCTWLPAITPDLKARFRELLAALAGPSESDELFYAALHALGDQFFNQMQMLPGNQFGSPADLDRIIGHGYATMNQPWTLGENLAWGTDSLATPAKIVDAWMHSPGHRVNILSRNFREIGVGIVPKAPSSSSQGATYTTDFGAKG